jgi:hypothetical protein
MSRQRERKEREREGDCKWTAPLASRNQDAFEHNITAYHGFLYKGEQFYIGTLLHMVVAA